MKKIKLITAVTTLATLGGASLAILSSCSSKNGGTSKDGNITIKGGNYDKEKSSVALNTKSYIYLKPTSEDKPITSLKKVVVGGTKLTSNQYTFEKISEANAIQATHKLTILASAMTSLKISIEVNTDGPTPTVSKTIKLNSEFADEDLQFDSIPSTVTIFEDTLSFTLTATTKKINITKKIALTDQNDDVCSNSITITTGSTVEEQFDVTITFTKSQYQALSETKTYNLKTTSDPVVPVNVTSITSVVFTGEKGKTAEAYKGEVFSKDKLVVKGTIDNGKEQELTIDEHYAVFNNGTDITDRIAGAATPYQLNTVGTQEFTVVGRSQTGTTVSQLFTIKVVDTAEHKMTFNVGQYPEESWVLEGLDEPIASREAAASFSFKIKNGSQAPFKYNITFSVAGKTDITLSNFAIKAFGKTAITQDLSSLYDGENDVTCNVTFTQVSKYIVLGQSSQAKADFPKLNVDKTAQEFTEQKQPSIKVQISNNGDTDVTVQMGLASKVSATTPDDKFGGWKTEQTIAPGNSYTWSISAAYADLPSSGELFVLFKTPEQKAYYSITDDGVVSMTDDGKAQTGDITIPNTVKNAQGANIPVLIIADNGFASSQATSISFNPDSTLTTIGANAFSNAKNLNSISFPKTLKEIKANAFSTTYAIPLKSATFADTNDWYTLYNDVPGDSIDVSNPSVNAAKLISVNDWCNKTLKVDAGFTHYVLSWDATYGYTRKNDSAAVMLSLSAGKKYKLTFTSGTGSFGVDFMQLLVDNPAPFNFDKDNSSSNIQSWDVVSNDPEVGYCISGDAVYNQAVTIALSVDTDTTAYVKSRIKPTNFEIDNDGLIKLTSDTGMKKESITVPATFKGQTVKGIQDGGFSQCAAKYISFEANSSFTKIGKNAFSECKSLISNAQGSSSFVLPEGLQTIDSGAFYNCVKLTHVKLPESLSEVGQNVFRNSTGSGGPTEIEFTDTSAHWYQSVDSAKSKLPIADTTTNATNFKNPDFPTEAKGNNWGGTGVKRVQMATITEVDGNDIEDEDTGKIIGYGYSAEIYDVNTKLTYPFQITVQEEYSNPSYVIFESWGSHTDIFVENVFVTVNGEKIQTSVSFSDRFVTVSWDATSIKADDIIIITCDFAFSDDYSIYSSHYF